MVLLLAAGGAQRAQPPLPMPHRAALGVLATLHHHLLRPLTIPLAAALACLPSLAALAARLLPLGPRGRSCSQLLPQRIRPQAAPTQHRRRRGALPGTLARRCRLPARRRHPRRRPCLPCRSLARPRVPIQPQLPPQLLPLLLDILP